MSQNGAVDLAPTKEAMDQSQEKSAVILFLGNACLSIVMVLVVVGGTIPYYFQYHEMLRTQNAKGFSLYVCMTLLMANILRILFWWGRHYELPLLLQSVVMIVCMLAMIDVSVRVQRKEILPSRQHRSIWSRNAATHFWQWTDFSSYAAATSIFAIITTIVTRVLLFSSLYVELIGFLALFLEANLGTPQLWANYVRKSTLGMSVGMVFMWLLGDVSKTIYFVFRQTPAQFWVCGIFQVIVDIVILLQVRCYRSSSIKPTKSDPFL